MQNRKFGVTEIILSTIALSLLVSIFLKACFDMDTNYDVGWYHLPFAARIWGIIPQESFTSVERIEDRYDGFPLFSHFLQGMLWKITGRIEATRLLAYSSILIYFYFLQSYYKIPWYVSTIAISTIPAVLTHAPGGFVDLPGNIGVSVAILVAYNLFRQSRLPTQKELWLIFLGAAFAANTKPQLQPLVFILWLVVGIRLIYLHLKYAISDKYQLWKTFSLALIASVLIFATPVKNIALHGNPFYPVKIEIAGIVFNHKAVPETYSHSNRPQKWLRSIFEVNTPEWSVDQSNHTNNSNYLDRAGGFFRAYVIFNLLLLVVLPVNEQLYNRKIDGQKSFDAVTALITVLFASIIPANFPQSHELRYFMFWMIVLVSLNLYLLFSPQSKINKWFKTDYSKIIYLLFFVIMCVKIKSFYLKPDFRTLKIYIDKTTKQEILQQLAAKQSNCLIGGYSPNPQENPTISVGQAFYYSSYFHPEIKSDYGIKVVKNPSQCGDLNTIPHIE